METDSVEVDRTKAPIYGVPEWIRSTHTQDGAVVLDIRHGQVFNVNLAGSRILELLKSEPASSEAEIIDEISREFKIDRDLIEGDVRDFLQTLNHHRLIEEWASQP